MNDSQLLFAAGGIGLIAGAVGAYVYIQTLKRKGELKGDTGPIGEKGERGERGESVFVREPYHPHEEGPDLPPQPKSEKIPFSTIDPGPVDEYRDIVKTNYNRRMSGLEDEKVHGKIQEETGEEEDDMNDEPYIAERPAYVEENGGYLVPRFINFQEFDTNEFDLDVSTITYLVNDDILVDEHDSILPSNQYLFGDLLEQITNDGPDEYFIESRRSNTLIDLIISKANFEEVVSRF